VQEVEADEELVLARRKASHLVELPDLVEEGIA